MARWTLDDITQKGLNVAGSAGQPVKQSSGKIDFRALGRMREGRMNKTEAAYRDILEADKRAGNVLWFAFEPMNLRLADKCFYKVDFLVLTKSMHLEVHEVKGGFIEDDALVKIKAAAEKFPFRFFIKQLKKGEWTTREF